MKLIIKNIGWTPQNPEGKFEPEGESFVYVTNEDASLFGVGNSIPEAVGNFVMNNRIESGFEIKMDSDSRQGNPLAFK
jgi:hypothetical protein